MNNLINIIYTRPIFLAVLLFALPTAIMAGDVYKWVDNEGNVQYGNTIPPEYIKNKHSTLNKKGFEVEQKDDVSIENERARAKILKEEEDKRKHAEEEKKRNARLAYDRLLLESYLSEKDLLEMRNRQITTIDGIITLTESNIKKLTSQLNKLNREIENHNADSETGTKVQAEIDATQKQIDDYHKFIANRRAEQEHIKANFDRDLVRLRELLSAKK